MKEDERILNAITPIVNARKTHKDDNLYSLQLNSYQLDMLQGLLDLYNKEKLNSLNLSEQLNKEKEKNIQDMIKDFECSNFIKNNYIHKNKIETLLQDVDNTKFINKHLKGMYLYDNLKCLLEE